MFFSVWCEIHDAWENNVRACMTCMVHLSAFLNYNLLKVNYKSDTVLSAFPLAVFLYVFFTGTSFQNAQISSYDTMLTAKCHLPCLSLPLSNLERPSAELTG